MRRTLRRRARDMVKGCLIAIRHGQRMLKNGGLKWRSGRGNLVNRLEFHADQFVLVPDQAAWADRLVHVEHDVETVGNAERGFHLQTRTDRRQIAHDAIDDRLMVVEQDARRLQRARSQFTSTFHETPPSTPVSHYGGRRSGMPYGNRYNCMGRRCLPHRPANAGRSASDNGSVKVTTPATTSSAVGAPRRSPTMP